MDDASTKDRLIKCFSAVFPEFSPAEIKSASVENTSGWDSIAHVTLLTLICEEFGVNVDFEQFADAGSFSGIVGLVEPLVSHR